MLLGIPVITQELDIDRPLGSGGLTAQVTVVPPVLVGDNAVIAVPRIKVKGLPA